MLSKMEQNYILEQYKKYGINDEEISFIESMIRPMDLGGADQ